MIGELSNHLWQSTVFAILAGLLNLAVRKNRAQVRYWLWFSASLKFLIPFSLLLAVGSYLGRTRPASSVAIPPITYTVVQIAEPFPATPPPAVPPTRSPGDWIPFALVIFWACGFAGIALMRLRGWLRIRAAVRSSTPMDIPFPVPVRSSPALLEPGVVGFFRPILLCPTGIVERLTPSQLEAVLAHERCHVERRDNLTAAIHMIVEAVFWFHPLVWWISARLMEERERACDEAVLELGSEPHVYAESILKTCQFCAESPLTCVSGVTGADLKKRIVRIMTERVAPKLDFCRKLLLCAAGLVAVAVPVVFGLVNSMQIRAASQAQITSATSSKFEVASIKPDKSGGGFGFGGDKAVFMIGWSPDRFTATGETLLTIIQMAYAVQGNQISGGPNWFSSEKYDIEAKVDGSVADELQKLSPDQRKIEQQRMLQALLAERFKLTIHRGTKELPAYALVIAKNSPKLREAKPGKTYPEGGAGDMGFGAGQLTGQGVPIADLVQELMDQRELGGRMVLNQTGLTGNYDFTLQWTPERRTSNGTQGPDNAPPADSSGPSLFTALQEQLGLKLEPTRGPVEVIVIDHIERPSAN